MLPDPILIHVYILFVLEPNLSYLLSVLVTFRSEFNPNSIKMKTTIFLLSFLAFSVSADPTSTYTYTHLPPPCRQNNNLRCMHQHKAEATPFCSSWLSIPMVTTTVKGYVTTEYYFHASVSQQCLFCFRTQIPRTQEPAPTCIITTAMSPYARRLLSNACSCMSVSTSTKTVAPHTSTGN